MPKNGLQGNSEYAIQFSFCKTKLNGIFGVALKAISSASGVELNYTKKSLGNVFYYVYKRFYFCHAFYVFRIFIGTFLHLCSEESDV